MSVSFYPNAPWVALRIVCGVFFLPHALGKFTQPRAAMGFFVAAGFRPAVPFVYLAFAIEVVLAGLLLGGIMVREAAVGSTVYLLVAAAAVVKVERKWLWHLGGCEYPFFWGLCCAILAASYPG